SSGMYARLGFAVAIHVHPDVLLIDEVLAVGDEAFQKKCLERINELRRLGRTIIYVSHNLGTVEEFCHRVLWLEAGAVRGLGPAREMTSRYRLSVHEKESKVALAAHHAQVATSDSGPPATLEPLPNDRTSQRWGTRDVEISAVRIRNAASEEAYLFESGEAVTIEIAYRVHRPVEEPVFGIGIYRNDGVWCYGTNTDIEGIPTAGLSDQGVVRILFPSLPLLEGSYTLDVAVHARDGYPYDYHRNYCTFDVRSLVKDAGVFRPPHQWWINGVPGEVLVAEKRTPSSHSQTKEVSA
ncbi:MAG: ABC transporter ATP-binding protein, partial [Chloroflexi bacterium]|nr:ABC transporter ATP-binding protein [Chloroflexota bacterium]